MNDREQLLVWQAEQRLTVEAQQALEGQEVAAESLARFSCALYDALARPLDSVPRFSHDEVVGFIEATLRGR